MLMMLGRAIDVKRQDDDILRYRGSIRIWTVNVAAAEELNVLSLFHTPVI